MFRTKRVSQKKLSLQALENREVPAGLNLEPDRIEVRVDSTATAFPSATVDVLANDTGSGTLKIASFFDPGVGTVERLAGAGPEGRDLLKYTPGYGFRGYDRFLYTATDSDGQSAMQEVIIDYTQDSSAYTPWGVSAPAEINAIKGQPISFTDENGPLLKVTSGGTATPNIGLILLWSAQEGAPYNGDSFAGAFSTSASSDAAFYPLPGRGVWIVGKLGEVNKALAGLTFTPAPGFSAANGVNLGIHGSLKSDLYVELDTSYNSILVKTAPVIGAPVTVADSFVVNTSLEPTSLNVLANDLAAPGLKPGEGKLTLIDVTLSAYSRGTVSIDPVTNEILFQPETGFIGVDTLAYVVSNEAGEVTQGLVSIKVMPPLLATAIKDERGTVVKVMNAETGYWLTEFVAFDASYRGEVTIALGDVDGDDFTDIVVSQTGVERAVTRVFNMWGGLIDDGAMMPFGAKFRGSYDMTTGDLDNDGKDEIIFAAKLAGGASVAVMDPLTGKKEMAKAVPALRSVPEVTVDDATDKVMLLGQNARGDVQMWTMNAAKPRAATTVRTVMSKAEVNRQTKANGAMIGYSLAFGDANNDGKNEAIITETYRNGTVRVSAAPEKGAVKLMMEQTTPPAGTDAPVISSVTVTDSGDLLFAGPQGVLSLESGSSFTWSGEVSFNFPDNKSFKFAIG